MQFYIVAGGYGKHPTWPAGNYLLEVASTEILKKEGGTSWQTAASLPSSRGGFSGVSLPNGHFMVSGDDRFLFKIHFLLCYFMMRPFRWSAEDA